MTIPDAAIIETEILAQTPFQGADISTPIAIDAYRIKRAKDIADALAQARAVEDV